MFFGGNELMLIGWKKDPSLRKEEEKHNKKFKRR
jgi:hypothetical protein